MTIEIVLKDVKPNEVFKYGKHKYYVASIGDHEPYGTYCCQRADLNYSSGMWLHSTDIVEVER